MAATKGLGAFSILLKTACPLRAASMDCAAVVKASLVALTV